MVTNLNRRFIDFAVGIFIVVAALGVIFIALRAANITDITADGGYVVRIHFDNVGGLIERAPVKSSGVRVGRVQSIAYNDEDHIAIVSVVIEGRYKFPVDSIFSIVSSNLLGGQYIAVEVGGEDETIQNDAVVQGNSAIVLEELIQKFLFDTAGDA